MGSATPSLSVIADPTKSRLPPQCACYPPCGQWVAESLCATLTTEYYYRRAFTTRDQVYTGVATWIEDFYNRRRIHISLGGKSPIEYEPHQAAWTTAA